MNIHQLPLLGLIALAAACSQPAEEAGDTPAEQRLATAPADSLARDTIGPVAYTYDATALVRAEIDLPLPPLFEKTVFAVKFIPAELAGNLGSEGCSYGISYDDAQCTAEEEIGVALALLERPLDDYAREFADADGDTDLEPSRFKGSRALQYRTTRAGTTLSYTFVPRDDLTFLIVDRQQDGEVAGRASLDALLSSVDLYPNPR